MNPVLNRITGVQFNNTSELDLRRVLDDPPNVADQLRQYVAGFSDEVRDNFEKFNLEAQIARLDASNLLYLVLGKFVDMDLEPESVSNSEMVRRRMLGLVMVHLSAWKGNSRNFALTEVYPR